MSSFQPLDPEIGGNPDPFNVVSFTGNDAQTGLYLDADQQNSSVLMKTSNTPVFYADKFQNVGINTLSPSAQLDVNSSSGSCIQLTYNSSSVNKANIGVTSDGKLVLVAGGSEVNIDNTTNFNVKAHNGGTAGLYLGNSLVKATADQLNYTMATPGTASKSMALIVDDNKNITGINSLTSTELTGTLNTDYQPNVTSVEVLDIASHTGVAGLKLGGVQVTATAEELNYVDVAAVGVAEASKALVLDGSRDITNINRVVAAKFEGQIQTAAQPLITSLGTLTGLAFNGPLTGLTQLSINTVETGRTLVLNSEAGNCIRMYYDAESSVANYADVLTDSVGNLLLTSSGGNVDITTHDGTVGLKLGGVIVNASADQLNYLYQSNPGAVVAGKAMVADSNRNIGNIAALTAVDLYGTVQTASQPSITSVNVLNIVSHDGNSGLKLNGTLVTALADEINYVKVTPGLAAANKALVLNVSKDISGINSLSATSLTGTLQTPAQPNVTSVGTLDSLAIVDNLTVGATTINEVEIKVLDDVTPGTVKASSAVVVDENKDISEFRNLTAVEVTGEIQTASQPKITSVTTLNITGANDGTNGLRLEGELITATATELNYVDTAVGTATANKAVVLDSNKSFTGISALTADNITGTLQTEAQPNIKSVGTLDSLAIVDNFTVGATTINEVEIKVLDDVTPGTVKASSAVVVDENKDISEFRNLTAITLTGEIQTASQPLITSVHDLDVTSHDGATTGLKLGGELLTATAAQINSIFGAGGTGTFNDLAVTHNLTIPNADGTSQGLILGSTLLTSSGTELNYLDGSLPGTVVPSKAVVVDDNKDISSFRNLTATNLTGTLQTAAQPNVTSVGTLTSLAVAGNVTVGSTVLSESEVAVLDAVTPGTVSASKALVVDASKNLSGINTLSTSGLTLLPNVVTYFGSTSSTTFTSSSELLNGGFSAYSSSLNKLVVFPGAGKSSNQVSTYSSYSATFAQYSYDSSSFPNCFGVVWQPSASRFVALSTTSGSSTAASLKYYTSTNGIGWTASYISSTYNVSSSFYYHAASGHFVFMAQNKFYYSSDIATWSSINLTLGVYQSSLDNITNSAYVNIGSYLFVSNVPLQSGAHPIMRWDGTNWTEAGSLASTLYLQKTYNPDEDTLYLFDRSRDTTSYTFSLQKITGVSTLSISSWTSSVQTTSLTLVDRIAQIRSSYISGIGVLVYGTRIAADDSNSYYSGRVIQIANGDITKSLILPSGGTTQTKYTFYLGMAIKWSDGTICFPAMYWPCTTMTYFSPVNSSAGITFGSTALSEAEMAVLDTVTQGTASASRALVLDASKNISGINSLSSASLTSTAGSLLMGATTISESEIAVLDAVSAGTVAASKAVVVDANKDIASFRNLTSVNLTSSAGSLTMGATTISESEIGVLDAVSAGTVAASKAVVVDANKDISSFRNLTSVNLTSSAGSLTMGTTNINESEIKVLDGVSPGTVKPLSAVVVDGNKDISSFRNLTSVTLTSTSGSLTMGGTNIIEDEIAVLDGAMPGTASAFKALVLDEFSNIGSVNNFSSSTLTATNGSLTMGETTIDEAEIAVLDAAVPGTAAPSKAVVLDENSDVENIHNLSANAFTSTAGLLTMGETTIDESEIGVLDTVVPGTVLASHAVVVDANKDISSFRKLTAVELTGTLQTVAQPNVTSVGTLDSLTVKPTGDIIMGETTITEQDAIYLVDATPGASLASTALIVDASKDISGIHALSADELTGTLQTAAQPHISSVDVLDVTEHDGTTQGLRLAGVLLEATAAQLNAIVDGTSASTFADATVTDDLTISGHDGMSNGLILGTTLVTSTGTELNYTDTTPGHAQASKALVFDENVSIDSINVLSANELYGAIKTPSQPGITSVEVLDVTAHDGTTQGLKLGGVLLEATAAQINSIFATAGPGGEGKFNNLSVTDTLTLNTPSLVLGETLLTSTGQELNYLHGSTPGTATAGNALVLDENKDITSIHALTAEQLTGTLQTAAQPNVTSVGTLMSLAVAGNVTVGSTVISESDIAQIDGIAPGQVAPSKAVVVDANKDISEFRTLTAVHLVSEDVAGTLLTAAQPNVTSVGELTSLAVAGDVNVGGTLTVGGTIISESEIVAIDAATPGTALATKAMITDSANSIGGINVLEATTLTGTLSTPAQPNVTSVGELTSLEVAGDVNVGGTLTVGGTIISESEIVAIDAATPGTALATKAMITDSDNSIGGINSLSATTLTGTLQTAAQPNIESVTILDVTAHDGEVGLSLGGTLVSATATELNYTDTTPGHAEASKALILDSSKNIDSIHNISLVGLTSETGAFTDTTNSTSSSTGAITTAGGVGIAKNLNVGVNTAVGGTLSVTGATTLTGDAAIASVTDTTSATTGAITTAGGVGIAKSLWVGANARVAGNATITGTTTFTGVASSNNATDSSSISSGALVVAGGVGIAKNLNVGVNAAIAGTLGVTGNTTLTGTESITNVTDSTSTSTGSFVTAGGAGIAKNLNVGANTSLTGTLAVTGASTLTGNTSVGGTLAVTGASAFTGAMTANGGVNALNVSLQGGGVNFSPSLITTSTTTTVASAYNGGYCYDYANNVIIHPNDNIGFNQLSFTSNEFATASTVINVAGAALTAYNAAYAGFSVSSGTPTFNPTTGMIAVSGYVYKSSPSITCTAILFIGNKDGLTSMFTFDTSTSSTSGAQIPTVAIKSNSEYIVNVYIDGAKKLYRTTDSGATFTEVSSTTGITNSQINDISWVGGTVNKYLLTGISPTLKYSSDGLTWGDCIKPALTESYLYNRVTYNSTLKIAIINARRTIWTSTDGITWVRPVYPTINEDISAVVSSPTSGLIIAYPQQENYYATYANIIYTLNGVDWSSINNIDLKTQTFGRNSLTRASNCVHPISGYAYGTHGYPGVSYRVRKMGPFNIDSTLFKMAVATGYLQTKSGTGYQWSTGSTTSVAGTQIMQLDSSLALTVPETISNTTDSSSTSTGSLVTAGGIGIAKNLNVGGALSLTGALTQAGTVSSTNTTDSSSTSTGAIITAGGVGIAKNLNVGVNAAIGGTLGVTGNATFAGIENISNTTESTSTTTGALTVAGGVGIVKNLNVGGATAITGTLGVTGNATFAGLESITNTTDSTSITTGSLTTAGGAGIAKNLNVGGDVSVTGASSLTGSVAVASTTESTSATSGSITTAGGVGIAKSLHVGVDASVTGNVSIGGSLTQTGAVAIADVTESDSITTGSLTTAGGAGVAKNLNVGGVTTITNETASADISTGALVVAGGVGIGSDLNVGGDVAIHGDSTLTGDFTLAGRFLSSNINLAPDLSSPFSTLPLTAITATESMLAINRDAGIAHIHASSALVVVPELVTVESIVYYATNNETTWASLAMTGAALTAYTANYDGYSIKVNQVNVNAWSNVVWVAGSLYNNATSSAAFVMSGTLDTGMDTLYVVGPVSNDSATAECTKLAVAVDDNNVAALRSEFGSTDLYYMNITSAATFSSVSTGSFVSVAWLNGLGKFVATRTDTSAVYTSTNVSATSWVSGITPTGVAPNTVYFNDTFNLAVAVGPDFLWYSTNGTTWTPCTYTALGGSDTFTAVVNSPVSGLVAAYSSYTNATKQVYYTVDGVSWTTASLTNAFGYVTPLTSNVAFDASKYAYTTSEFETNSVIQKIGPITSSSMTYNTKVVAGFVTNESATGYQWFNDSTPTVAGNELMKLDATNLEVAPIVDITNTTNSVSTTTGSLVTDGGVGIAKNLTVGMDVAIGGQLSITGGFSQTGTLAVDNATNSTSPSTGAITTIGGVGIAKNLNVGQATAIGSTLTVTGATALSSTLAVGSATDSTSPSTGSIITEGGVGIAQALNVGSTATIAGDVSIAGDTTHDGTLAINNSANSTSSSTGAITTTGGVGITQNLSVGMNAAVDGNLSITGLSVFSGEVSITNVNDATSAAIGGALTISGGAAVAKSLFVGNNASVTGNLSVDGTIALNNTTDATTSSSGALVLAGGVGIAKALNVGTTATIGETLVVGGVIDVTNTTDSLSVVTGSITTEGGVGIAKTLYVGTGIYGTIMTANQPYITSVTTLDITGANAGTAGLRLDGQLITTTATELNYLDGSFPGLASAGNALVLDGSLNIDGIHALTADELTGTLMTTSQPNIAELATVNIADLSIAGTHLTATAEQINSIFGDGGTGTFTNLTVNNTLTLAHADGASMGLVLGTTLVTASANELNYLDGVTPGTASIFNALVLDASSNIEGINYLSATSVEGTLMTSYQPNLESVDILDITGHDGSTAGLRLAGDLVTSTATELNYVDVTTTGVAQGEKAIVLNANKDITGINALTATSLTGTLQTAAQPNVTSVGTLTSLAVAGDLTIGSTVISNTDITKLDNITNGTGAADKALVLDADRNISNIHTLSADVLSIGTPNNSDLPIECGAVSYQFSGAYAYSNQANAHGLMDNGMGSTSLYSSRFDGRILVTGEVEVTSDRRMKKNMIPLELDLAKRFVHESKPIRFNWKSGDEKTEFGWEAQQIAKANFTELVSMTPYPGLEEEIDEDGFISPANIKFSLAPGKVIPLLTLTTKDLYEQNEEKDRKIAALEERLSALEELITKLV